MNDERRRSVDEIAEYLWVSKDTVYAWVREGGAAASSEELAHD